MNIKAKLTRLEHLEGERLDAEFRRRLKEVIALLTTDQRKQLLTDILLACPEIEDGSAEQWRQAQCSEPIANKRQNVRGITAWLDALRGGNIVAIYDYLASVRQMRGFERI